MYKILLIIVAIIIGFLMLYKYDRFNYDNNDNLFRSPEDATLDDKKFYGGYSISGVNKGLSSSLSFWIYIDDWNYRYMQKKYIFEKGGFMGYLSPATADLVIEMPILMHQASETATYNNITLQKWTHICIIIENRNLDLWINGELHISKYLKNIPLIAEKEPLNITPDGGFKGRISNVNVWEHTIGKKVIQHMYNEGPEYKSFFSNYKEDAVDVPQCPVVKPGSNKGEKDVKEGFTSKSHDPKKKKAGEKEEDNEMINEAININIQKEIDRRNSIKNWDAIEEAKERDKQHKLEMQRRKLKKDFPFGKLIMQYDKDNDNQISYNELDKKYPDFNGKLSNELRGLALDTNSDEKLSYSELNNNTSKTDRLAEGLLELHGEQLSGTEKRKYKANINKQYMLWELKKAQQQFFKDKPKDSIEKQNYKFIQTRINGYDKIHYNMSNIVEEVITNKQFYKLFYKYKTNKKSKMMSYGDIFKYLEAMQIGLEGLKKYPKLSQYIPFYKQPIPKKYTLKAIAKLTVAYMLFINGKDL